MQACRCDAVPDALDMAERQLFLDAVVAENGRRGAVCGECGHFDLNDLGQPDVGVCVDVRPRRAECGKCGKPRFEFETVYEWARAGDPAGDCERFVADWRGA